METGIMKNFIAFRKVGGVSGWKNWPNWIQITHPTTNEHTQTNKMIWLS